MARTIVNVGKLANKQKLDEKIREAREAGALIETDMLSGTVQAFFDSQILFRAIQKDANTWIILYNRIYYPSN